MDNLVDICYDLEEEWSECDLCGSYPSELTLREWEDGGEWELQISYACYGGMNMFGSDYSDKDLEEILADAKRFELWDEEKEKSIRDAVGVLIKKGKE